MSKTARIVAVCLSEEKGTRKNPIESGRLIEGEGFEGDAHAGTPHRQISILCQSSANKLSSECNDLNPGDFAENLLVDGCDHTDMPVGTVLELANGPRLKVTQVGKECHSKCEIARLTGRCVMPEEGIFAKVVKEGPVKAGDEMSIMTIKSAVLVASDRISEGRREDESGEFARDLLNEFTDVAAKVIVPDECDRIERQLLDWCESGINLIVTIGGTGLSERDVTPEATERVIEREIRAIPAALLVNGLVETPKAMLSRAHAGTRGQTLIINLPGSRSAVKHSLEYLQQIIPHAIEVLRGNANE